MPSISRRHLVGLLVPVTLALFATSLHADSPPPEQSAGLQIYFIDVMGGAATLIVTPTKESILVDSGWPGFDDRDPNRIVHVPREVAGCDHLDHLVTTHWHRDHFGGVEGLAKQVEIRHFWDRGLPEDRIEGLDFPDGPDSDDPLGVAYRAASEGKRRVLTPGQRFDLGDGASVLILASGAKVLTAADRWRGSDEAETDAVNPLCAEAPEDRPEDHSDNARSVAFLLSYGEFQFFDGGDLTWNIEKQLVCPRDLIGPVDLYQVTHHGMDISNHPTLVQTIRPTVAIMNNGPRKGGVPATVKLLQSVDSIKASYQLHRNVQTGPEDNTDTALIANVDEAGGEFIGVRVEPGGARYEVRIGVEGEPREFEAR